MAKVSFSGEFSPYMPTPIGGYSSYVSNASVMISFAGYTFNLRGDFSVPHNSNLIVQGEATGVAYSVSIGGPSGWITVDNTSIQLSEVTAAAKSLDLSTLVAKLLGSSDAIAGLGDVRFGGAGNDTFDWGDKDVLFGGAGTDTFKSIFSSENSVISQTDMGTVLTHQHVNTKTIMVGIEKIEFTDKTVEISPAAPLYEFAAAARSAILREAPTDFRAYEDGKAGSKAAITAALIEEAEDSTIPAVIAYQEILGRTPSSAQLDGLAGYVSSQVNSTGYQATANPRLGGYEAMGLGLSGTPEFATKFGGGTEAAMVSAEYQHLFGRAASSAQVDHFVSQIDYFEGLYVGAGISEADAAIKARGAVIGQMLGHAAGEKADIHDAAVAWLGKLADGGGGYGSPLEMI